MLSRFQLIRNISQFDSFTGTADHGLHKFSALYAENGRGKTTIAAILRSLGTGDPLPISERKRLGSAPEATPHVIFHRNGQEAAMFQNGAWNAQAPKVAVFDDHFVDENIYSGLVVETEHRQKLHELIVGNEGISLNRRLQEQVARIEAHNTALRTKGAAIPVEDRGSMTPEDFCALAVLENADTAIAEGERSVLAATKEEGVRNTSTFAEISLPGMDKGKITALLNKDLPDLDAMAASWVKAHIMQIGDQGESWISQGIERIFSPQKDKECCPFCAQDISQSELVQNFRIFFGDTYAALKRDVTNATVQLERLHGGDVPAAFERAVSILRDRRTFWTQFIGDLPEVVIDTAAIVQAWREAREGLATLFQEKQWTPLEKIILREDVASKIDVFNGHCQSIRDVSAAFQAFNEKIALVKESAKAGNLHTLRADLAKLKARKARHEEENNALCQAFLDEKTAKTATETTRDQIKAELNTYQNQIFPVYQANINEYLRRFNAGFRLDSLASAANRGGATCNYSVVVNNSSVAVSGSGAGTPSFRTVLSAGDRNTLALAFFFAMIDRDADIANMLVVIDDPMTSLDEHRTEATVQEIKKLVDRVAQVLVLSHSKAFLCNLWQRLEHVQRSSYEIQRAGTGSTIATWDVTRDCVTEHDRRHDSLLLFVRQGISDPSQVRGIAQSLRPHLESFLRVACSEHMRPGKLLGPFIHECRQKLGTVDEVLANDQIQELEELKEYANRYMHDTNPAWRTETINDTELLSFAQRTLVFVSA